MESMENSACAASSASPSPTTSGVIRAEPAAEAAQRRRLLALFEARELTDVALVVQGQVIAAHRVVLASASPFFHALFTSGMRESRAARVELNDVHAPALRELLRYMYDGQLRVAGDTILALLHTANQLEMLEVVEICCKQLMLELSVHNCVDIFLCCESLKMRPACRLLAHAARAMIETYFSDVYRTDAFKNLPLYAVIKLLLRRKLRLQDDAAVRSWLMHDPASRKIELTRVFGSLQAASDPDRKTAAASLSLYQALSSSGMINSKDRVADDGRAALTAPSLEQHKPASAGSSTGGDVQQQPTPPPPPPELTPTIFAIGGFNGPSALKTVEYLDFHSNEWFAAASMLEKRSYSGVVVSEQHQIFVVGGTCSSRHLKSMEMFDPEANAWTLMPPMRRARSYLGAAFAGGFIYVVGGFNGMAHLSSVERYDVQAQTWEEVQPLGVGRSGLAVVALNGLIYAIGGYDGRKHLKSVEVFCPRQNQWFPVASMRYARNGPAAVAQPKSNSILVYGGESRHGIRMNTSERLALPASDSASSGSDGSSNPDGAGVWHDMDAFVDSRSGHVAFSFLADSFLFCLGGSNKKDEYLDTVHRYDHLTKQWSVHSRMLSQRCGLNVAVALTSARASCFQKKPTTTTNSAGAADRSAPATTTTSTPQEQQQAAREPPPPPPPSSTTSAPMA
ncbi:hypothetical protein PybrP1_002874 [[Pythium] brassicae (nom. inval.)]|nr:hypothetical protein PybrP1_002874 [[Pythium] brassicae (nom. inval.)]